MRTHVQVVGWLQVALGILDLLLALLLLTVFLGVGLVGGLAGEPKALLFGGLLGPVVGGIIVLTAVPNLLAGWGVLTHRGWGRILALVLAVFNFFKFPWGTLFTIYCFWVLLHDDTARIFARRG